MDKTNTTKDLRGKAKERLVRKNDGMREGPQTSVWASSKGDFVR